MKYSKDEEERAERTSVKMWPGITAGITIGLIAFVLSFDALRLVFVACGINPWLSWGGPVCVDGTILLCTWATWGFKKGHIRGAVYPWVGLVLFSGFSITGNALHAMINTGLVLPDWVPPVIMSIPPVALLYATHLIVIIAGDRLDKINTAGTADRTADERPSIFPQAAPMPAAWQDQPEPAPVRDMDRNIPEPPSPTPMPAPLDVPQSTPRRHPEPAPIVEPDPVAEPAARTAEPEPRPQAVADDLASLPDLNNWPLIVPDMDKRNHAPAPEDDARPKAVEAEAPVADASTPTDKEAAHSSIPQAVTTGSETVSDAVDSPADVSETAAVVAPVTSKRLESAPAEESTEHAGQAEPSTEPEPVEERRDTGADDADKEPSPMTSEEDEEDEEDGKPEPAAKPKATRTRKASAADDEWLAWADRLKGEGIAITPRQALDDGLAHSRTTAKRRLSEMKKKYPERF